MSQIFKDICTVLSGNIVNASLNLFFIYLFISKFGLENFGKHSYFQAILLTCLVLSKPNIWQAFISFLATEKNKHHEYVFFWTIDIILSFVSVLITLLAAFYFLETYWVILLIPYVCFYNNGFVLGYLRSSHRFHFYAIAQTVSAVVKLLVLTFIPFSNAATYICYLFLADGIIWAFLYLIVLRSSAVLKYKRNILFSRLKNNYHKKIKFVFGTYLTSTLDLPVAHLDKVIVGVFLSPSLLGVYTVLRRLCLIFSITSESITYVMFPEYSKNLKNGLKGKKIIISLVKKQILFTLTIGLLALTFTFFSFDYINNIIFNNELGDILSLIILTITIQVIGLTFTWLNPLIVTFRLIKQNNFITLISNMIYITALSLFTYYFGIYGAISALALQYLCVAYLKYKIIKKHWL